MKVSFGIIYTAVACFAMAFMFSLTDRESDGQSEKKNVNGAILFQTVFKRASEENSCRIKSDCTLDHDNSVKGFFAGNLDTVILD